MQDAYLQIKQLPVLQKNCSDMQVDLREIFRGVLSKFDLNITSSYSLQIILFSHTQWKFQNT